MSVIWAGVMWMVYCPCCSCSERLVLSATVSVGCAPVCQPALCGRCAAQLLRWRRGLGPGLPPHAAPGHAEEQGAQDEGACGSPQMSRWRRSSETCRHWSSATSNTAIGVSPGVVQLGACGRAASLSKSSAPPARRTFPCSLSQVLCRWARSCTSSFLSSAVTDINCADLGFLRRRL